MRMTPAGAALVLLHLSAYAYVWFGSYHGLPGNLTLGPVLAASSAFITVGILCLRRRVRMPGVVRHVFAVALAALAWMCVVELKSGAGVSVLRVLAGRVAIGPVLAFVVYVLATNRSRVRGLAWTLVVAGTISAAVGIGQYAWGGLFWDLWRITGDRAGFESTLQRGWAAGLSSFSVSLANQLVGLVPLAVALALTLHGLGRMMGFVGVLVLLGGLLLTFSRSAIVGALVGSFLTVRFGLRRFGPRVALLLLALGVVSYVGAGWLLNPKLISVTDLSAASRIPLLLTGTLTGLRNPLGIGRGQYFTEVGEVFEEIQSFRGADLALSMTSHNQFINMLGYYGLPGFALAALFYLAVWRVLLIELRRAKTSSEPYQLWTSGLHGSVAGYLLNSMFHNVGPFIGDPLHWYLIGLVCATARVQRLSGEAQPTANPLGVLIRAPVLTLDGRNPKRGIWASSRALGGPSSPSSRGH